MIQVEVEDNTAAFRWGRSIKLGSIKQSLLEKGDSLFLYPMPLLPARNALARTSVCDTMSLMRLRTSFLLAVCTVGLASCTAHAQQVTTPLGDTLTKALKSSSLTTVGSHPFHVNLHIHDAADSTATTNADIEEYWTSPTLWKRTVTAPGLRQVITVNQTGTYVENTGDYFPTWLRAFGNALFEPVPNIANWNRPEALLLQTTGVNGTRSAPCLSNKIRFGEGSVPVLGSICFYENGLISAIRLPAYSVEFNQFAEFNGKQVPYLYMLKPLGGTFFVGKIQTLEGSSKKEAFFATPSVAISLNSFNSLQLPQPTLEKLSLAPIKPVWPIVTAGKTEGTVTAYVSLDRTGVIREVDILDSDNWQLQKTVKNYLIGQKWRGAVSNGNPIQVEGAIAIPFTTAAAANAPAGLNDAVPVGAAVLSGKKISGASPIYPEDAKARHISGAVYLHAIIGIDGHIERLGVIDAPDKSLADASLTAVRAWTYQPYLLNGIPAQVDTTITVHFNFGPAR